MSQEQEKTFWMGHASGLAATVIAHAVLVVMLVAFHGSAGGAISHGTPLVPPPPSIQAKLVKLGRPANTQRTRRETIVATTPDTGIAVSKTNREETKVRPTKAPTKDAVVDEALQRALARAAELGRQGS